MNETFHIKTADGMTQLEFKKEDANSYITTIKDTTMNASAGVFHYGGDGIDRYFAELSENWKGWSGTKKWESLEGTLQFKATTDRTGHVTLVVQLDNGTPYHWRIIACFLIEAGRLEEIASEIRKFAISIGAA